MRVPTALPTVIFLIPPSLALRRLAFGLAALGLAGAALGADGIGRREGAIRYAEPVRVERSLPVPAAGGAVSASAGPRLIEFEAYGRHFELELESNEAVLGRLPFERRRALPARTLYRGRLAGQPGSWARVTVLADGVHGLVHDGTELYLLAPAGRVRARLQSPLHAGDRETVLFRAADTEAVGGRCTALEPDPTTASDGEREPSLATAYDALAAELESLRATLSSDPTLDAAVVNRELQLAILGDYEFSSRRANPEGDLIALVNAVDGIFRAQLGLTVVASELRAFRDVADPFVSNDPRRLLDEVGDYRVGNAAIRATDVTHLATSRSLDGSTVGIAYRGAVCTNRDAVSLSEQNDPSAGYFIFAHELGHNLGAPHDAEPGSACSAVPPQFLMAPSVNFSSTFSTCSIGQMQPLIATAACLGPAPPDGVVSLPGPSLIVAYTNQPASTRFLVDSVGGGTLRDARLTLDSGVLAPMSASTTRGSCEQLTPNSSVCRFGDLQPGDQVSVDLRIESTGDVAGDYPLQARLSAAGDGNPNNDTGLATLRVQAGSPLSLSIASSPSGIGVGGRGDVTANVHNVGLADFGGMSIDITATGAAIEIDGASGPSATCTRQAVRFWRCSYANPLAAGATTTVTASALGLALGSGQVVFRPVVSGPGPPSTATANVQVKPDADVALLSGLHPISSTIEGRPFRATLRLRTDGVEDSRNIRLSGTLPEGLALLGQVGADDCSVDAATRSLVCVIGDRAPSINSHLLEWELLAATPGTYTLPLTVSSDNDAVPGNNAVSSVLNVVPDVDLGIAIAEAPATHKLGRVLDYRFTATAATRPIPGASVRFEVSPALLGIESATTEAGSCALTAGGAHCTLGELPAGARPAIVLRARAIASGNTRVYATASAPGDADTSNQTRSSAVTVLPLGDAGVLTQPPGAQPREDQAFDLTPFSVTASRATESVALELNVPSSVRIESASIAGGACTIATPLRCELGDLAAGDSRALQLRIVAADVGPVTLTARTLSPDDDNPANDSATLTLTVTTLVVQPPIATGGSGGGGGGGAIDPGWLALLLAGGLAASRRRRSQVPSEQ